jgi:hypothetical protein
MNMVAVFDDIISRKPAASEWQAWACLIRQTLCFGKVEDDLSDSRLEKLTGLRRDRARAAVRNIVDLGLFEIAGKGKYGTVYRVPKRFLGDDGYIGFSANIGASETDAYAEITEDTHETVTPEHNDAYQNLVETNRMLVEVNQVLVNANQELVKTHQDLVNRLPTIGEQLTKFWSNAYQELVTDINKPKHNKTPTTLNPDSGEEVPETEIEERWPEQWERLGQGVDNFQVWEQYAATPASQAPIAGKPTPASQTSARGINAEALQYPEALTAEELVEAPKKLDGLHPQVAQEVLDALAWKMRSGTVRKPIGMLVHLANKAREGTFDRTPALEWRKAQQSAQAKENAISAVELNNLAVEIKNIQRLHKESGEEVFFEQAEAMKATYFEKLAVYRANLVVQKEFTHA